MKSTRTPAFSVALGLFVPSALALCAHLVLWWVFFSGLRWPLEFHEALAWAVYAILALSFALVAAGLARLLRGAFRVPWFAAVAWALAAAATGLWPLAALLPAARRAGNAAAARLAAWGGGVFLAATALALAGRFAGAPVFWPLFATAAAGAALVLASLRALDGGSLPHRALAWAFAAVFLVSLATQPALHLAGVRREADAAFAELRAAIGSAVDPESLYPGRPPVAEADDPVAALDPEAIKAERASLQELRQMFERADGEARRHPFQPDELAAAAAWFASHTSLVAAAEAMSEPGYRSCLPGPASFDDTLREGDFPYREPRVIEAFRAMNALATRARLAIAAGDASAGAQALRRLENAAELVEDDALLIDYLLAASLRQMSFGLVSERIDLWSEEDLLALERAAEAAAASAGDRLRTAIDWETYWQERIFEKYVRDNFRQNVAATRGSGALGWWLAAERRARYRDSVLSWKTVNEILRAGPDAAVGEEIDRLIEDEKARVATLPPLSRMMSFSLAGMLDTVVSSWDHASFVRAAVAVERYRRAHGGALPPSLDALVPEYLPAVPRAARTGAPLVYEPGPLDIPEETVSALRDPDQAAAESDAEFRARFGDADKVTVGQIVEAVNDGAFPDKPEPEPRVLPAQTLPGFRLVLPASRARDEDVSRDFVLGPATPSPAADESHAESAESESHAESAENAE